MGDLPEPFTYWAEPIDPADRQSWKRFGTSRAGREFLYRLFDAERVLLYVGITWNPFVRWTSHSKTHAWWADVDFAELYEYSDEDARLTETTCIKGSMPKHNKHQNPRWHRGEN